LTKKVPFVTALVESLLSVTVGVVQMPVPGDPDPV
jgi:hypothetical protein